MISKNRIKKLEKSLKIDSEHIVVTIRWHNDDYPFENTKEEKEFINWKVEQIKKESSLPVILV